MDGLLDLAHRDGIDIKPTLLRVLTDLYVQANAHSDDEERQFIELTSRLIDQVDDGALVPLGWYLSPAARQALRQQVAVKVPGQC